MNCKSEHPLGRIIYQTAQQMTNYAEKILSPLDATVEQLHILKNLIENNYITQRQLADFCGKTAANITRILDRLETKSLIERQPDPNDRRATLISITKSGRTLVEDVESIFESTENDFLHGITPHQENIVRESLEKIQNNLIKLTDKMEKNA